MARSIRLAVLVAVAAAVRVTGRLLGNCLGIAVQSDRLPHNCCQCFPTSGEGRIDSVGESSYLKVTRYLLDQIQGWAPGWDLDDPAANKDCPSAVDRHAAQQLGGLWD